MRQALTRHPQSRGATAIRIDVEVVRPRPGHLVLRYLVTGRPRDLRLPPAAAPKRADELWRHTCFEAFVRPLPGAAYYEFNFAPSTQWAAYGFSAYRSGMRVANEVTAPLIDAQSTDDAYTLQAALDLERLPSDAAWRLGLSAVIEDSKGNISYWALAHPPGKADFHHSDCFALELAGASGS
jgi:hypothetical protein